MHRSRHWRQAVPARGGLDCGQPDCRSGLLAMVVEDFAGSPFLPSVRGSLYSPVLQTKRSRCVLPVQPPDIVPQTTKNTPNLEPSDTVSVGYTSSNAIKIGVS